MTFDIEALRVPPGKNLHLANIDPKSTPEWSGSDKEEGKVRVEELNARLEQLQELLYAEGKQRLLVVLQAMDAGGKDGTIRHVFDGVNPSGVRAPAFKRPTGKELAHDYLWRVHQEVPGDGEVVIFNRSHYEDVLVVRVMDIVPEQRWRKRYEHIVDFERMLADEGTTIVKIYLHISKEEQQERLQDRLDIPEKNWKFETGDLDMRERWDDFMEAFEEALEKTSTPHAPWYVVPANRKWYRNIAVLEILVQTLEGLHMSFPEPEEGLADIVIPD